MKTILFVVLAFTGFVCTTDPRVSDEPAAVVIDLPPSHDALYHGMNDANIYITWNAHSQDLIPFPLELINYDSGLFGMKADWLDSSGTIEYLGSVILDNLHQMRSLPPAILHMESKTMQNLISSQ